MRYVVEGAGDAEAVVTCGDVEVDFGGGDVFVAEDFLNGSEVGSVFEEVGCEGVAEGVAGDAFMDADGFGGALDGIVVDGAEEVVAAFEAGFGVDGGLPGGEEPEPLEGGGCVAEFAGEGAGHVDAGEAGIPIVLPNQAEGFDVIGKLFEEEFGEDGGAVLIALAAADGEGAADEIDVLDAEADEFVEPEARAVLKPGGEGVSRVGFLLDGVGLVELGEELEGFARREDDGDACVGAFEFDAEDGVFVFEDVFEEEGEGIEGLFLGGVGAVFVVDDGGEELGGGIDFEDFLGASGEGGVSGGPCAVAELGATGKATAGAGGFDSGTDALGKAAVIGAGMGAGIDPCEIPFDGVGPLVELPIFAGPVFAEDFGFPKDFGGVAICREIVAKAEVLKPFEEDEEAAAFGIGEAAKACEILPPAPTGFFGMHGCMLVRLGRDASRESVRMNGLLKESKVGR